MLVLFSKIIILPVVAYPVVMEPSLEPFVRMLRLVVSVVSVIIWGASGGDFQSML
jgi:hypothetical protein